MSVFRLPDSLIKEIEAMIGDFWWGDGERNKLHWVSWDVMCRSKRDGGMGFRDLKAFNLALLAKQVWRLLENPDCLLSRLYKAKYFSNSSILDAQLGSSPSFSWRCIHEAIIVVNAGMIWRVGDGNSLKIWGDPWIPRPNSFLPITPQHPELTEQKVAYLIDENTRSWAVERVRELFLEVDCEIIFSIPVGNLAYPDRKVWHYNANGRFSVQSAYHVIRDKGLRRKNVEEREGVSVARDWSFIWKIKIPKKINIFLWRVCLNILPTKSNLVRRHIAAEQQCTVCGCGEETLYHCFTSCHVARQVWALSLLPIKLMMRSDEDGEMWMRRLIKECEKDDVIMIVVTFWALWYNRNKVTVGDGAYSPDNIVCFVAAYLHSWKTFGIMSMKRRDIDDPCVWSAPLDGWIKINFDGAIFHEQGLSGMGIIAKNSKGEEIARVAQRMGGVLSANSIEACTARMAINVAIQLGWTKVIMEGDCLSVIHDILMASTDEAEYANVIRDMRCILDGENDFIFQWVSREANTDAHTIARTTMENSSWFREDMLIG